jgi:4-aminobutyrate aminotransferase-like enzyme
MNYVTLGYPIDESHIDVIATFNVTNLRAVNPVLADELEAVVLNLNHRLQTDMHNRQDTPDTIDLTED